MRRKLRSARAAKTPKKRAIQEAGRPKSREETPKEGYEIDEIVVDIATQQYRAAHKSQMHFLQCRQNQGDEVAGKPFYFRRIDRLFLTLRSARAVRNKRGRSWLNERPKSREETPVWATVEVKRHRNRLQCMRCFA
jgi:hypothetical protein